MPELRHSRPDRESSSAGNAGLQVQKVSHDHVAQVIANPFLWNENQLTRFPIESGMTQEKTADV